MSQSHCGGFSMYSEISPSLTTTGVWHGLVSVWQNCLFTPKCHNIGIWSSVCLFACFFLRAFTAAHGGRKAPLPRQGVRCTGAAEQQGKGEHFGLTKTNGCNSQRKARISENALSSPHPAPNPRHSPASYHVSGCLCQESDAGSTQKGPRIPHWCWLQSELCTLCWDGASRG